MQLITPMLEEMVPRWDTYLKLCRGRFDKFEHEILSAMVALRSQVKGTIPLNHPTIEIIS